jgi:hypothetical protein
MDLSQQLLHVTANVDAAMTLQALFGSTAQLQRLMIATRWPIAFPSLSSVLLVSTHDLNRFPSPHSLFVVQLQIGALESSGRRPKTACCL